MTTSRNLRSPVHVVPAEREGFDHRASSTCPCGPTASHVDLATGAPAWLHHRMQSPHSHAGVGVALSDAADRPAVRLDFSPTRRPFDLYRARRMTMHRVVHSPGGPLDGR